MKERRKEKGGKEKEGMKERKKDATNC